MFCECETDSSGSEALWMVVTDINGIEILDFISREVTPNFEIKIR
jgi:hypothetical protein